MSKKVVPLIIAGGRGSRFWPLSREKKPKQFLSIDGGEPLLKRCFERGRAVAVDADPYVIAGEDQADLVKEVLGEDGDGYHLIVEPTGRNTAAAVALGSRVIAEAEGDAAIVVLPSDHRINATDRFVETVYKAVTVAEREGALTVIGIAPRYPATGYGYAERGAHVDGDGFSYFKVKRFVEKPQREKARRYLKKGTYSWNSGIVVATAAVLADVCRRHLPATAAVCDVYADREALKRGYEELEAVSFDNAVLEKEKRVFLVEADFDWEDVGSYHHLSALIPPDGNGNIRRGNHVLHAVRDCVIVTDNRLTAVIGVKDLAVIEDDGVLLVCPRRRVEEVRAVVASLDDGNEIFK